MKTQRIKGKNPIFLPFHILTDSSHILFKIAKLQTFQLFQIPRLEKIYIWRVGCCLLLFVCTPLVTDVTLAF